MSLSLRDQLIAAGLATKKQARQAQPPARAPQAPKNRPPPVPAATLAAQKAQAEKFARDQALNRKQQEKAERKARQAQTRQLIEQCCVPRVETDDYFNFTDGGKVRRVAVNPALRAELTAGTLLIARAGERYYFVPAGAADRIRERDPSAIVASQAPPASDISDEAYKDFVVPDDLTW